MATQPAAPALGPAHPPSALRPAVAGARRLSPEGALRVIADVLRAEARRRRGCSGHAWTDAEAGRWHAGTRLGAPELDLDSIELVAVGARVNEMFHLYESGAEDGLMADLTLGGWANVVCRAVEEATNPRLTFLTSGSSGLPRPCPHSWADLAQEADALARVFADRRRIVGLVPANHLFGFIFTVMLPGRLGVPVLDARGLSPALLARTLNPGDLIVNFPAGYEALAISLPSLGNADGVCSTAPCSPALWRSLLDRGLGRLVEIYGCSELGGIGVRSGPEDPLTLLEHWSPAEDGTTLHRAPPPGAIGPAAPAWPPDRLEFEPSGRRFRVAGRIDGAVKVAGINVFPAHVASVLTQVPGVAQARVRPMRRGEGDRLKAFIVPVPGQDPEELRLRVIEHARVMLSAPERPVGLTFGPSLPTGPMGKPADW